MDLSFGARDALGGRVEDRVPQLGLIAEHRMGTVDATYPKYDVHIRHLIAYVRTRMRELCEDE